MKKLFIIFLFVTTICSISFCNEQKERINVAFCIDNNYPLYTMLAINSILLNNKSNSDYTFYIVNNNLSYWNKLRMKLYVKSKKQKIEFIHVDTTNIDNGKNIFKGTITNYITRIGTARILLPEILPENLDKILYLDADILVLSDLKELYDIPLDNYYAGMVLERIILDKERKIFQNKSEFYNSGVILMNIPLWKEYKLPEKIIDYIQNNELYLVDQDAINAVLKDKIKNLPFKFNNQVASNGMLPDKQIKSMFNLQDLPNYDDITIYDIIGKPLTDIEDTCILHFVTSRKPWKKYKSFYLFDIYYDYWGKSGFIFEKFMLVCKYYYDKSLFKKLIIISTVY